MKLSPSVSHSWLLLAACALGLACSSDTSAPEPDRGDLEVVVLTDGPDPDPSGYDLLVGSRAPVATAASDTVLVSELPVGAVTLQLEDVAANCEVKAPHPRIVEIGRGTTTHVTMDVSCIENSGTVQIQVAMSGPVSDKSGYFVEIGEQTLAVTANPANLVFPGVPAGEHEVRFHALASFCQGPVDPRVAVQPGTLTNSVVNIQCEYSVLGRILFSAAPPGTDAYFLFTVAPDGSDLVPFGDHSTLFRSQLQSSASRDGSRIVLLYGTDIYAMDGDGSNMRAVPNGSDAFTPQISPDGGRIAFSRGGDIWVMNFDGSNLAELTSVVEGEDFSPAWSPDGQTLAFENRSASDDWIDWNIYTIGVDGSNPTLVTSEAPGPDLEPAWHPDGGRLAFSSVREGSFYIVTTLLDGSDLTILSGDGRDPFWSPDGSRISYHIDGFMAGVYVVDVSTGQSILVTSDLQDDRQAVQSFWGAPLP